MKSDKILMIIPKLQELSESELDKVENAVNACIIVQNLQNLVKVD